MLLSCNSGNSKENKTEESSQTLGVSNNSSTLANEVEESFSTTFTSTSALRKFRGIGPRVKYKTVGLAAGEWVWDPQDKSSADNEGTILVAEDGKRLKRIYQGDALIEWFGVKSGNITFDNSSIIQQAITSCKTIAFQKGKVYTIKREILLDRINNLHLKLNGSTISNVNLEVKTLKFDHCNNVTVESGSLTRPTLPATQNSNDQHTLTFIGCRDIIVKNMHILNAPEMGICIMSAINATMLNNTIEHTLRDGIYAHYSLNVKYIGNKLSNIKDDALSIHDYGLDREKPEILKEGRIQAGNALVSKNVVTNAMQGFSSIGCADITIDGNSFSKTVNAGIAVFNSETLHVGSTARVKNIKITNNKLIHCGNDALINNVLLSNGGQVSSGHAAIYVACNGPDNTFASSKLRSSNIHIVDNTITESGVNGILCYNIDGLQFQNNTFRNCHANTTNAPQFTGNICEVYNCTNILVKDNNVIDTRNPPLHDSAYIIDNSTGTFSKGLNKGWRSFDTKIEHSPKLSVK